MVSEELNPYCCVEILCVKPIQANCLSYTVLSRVLFNVCFIHACTGQKQTLHLKLKLVHIIVLNLFSVFSYLDSADVHLILIEIPP